VAVGSGTNTIAYSVDGITWTGIGANIFSTIGRGIGWNGRRWIGVGDLIACSSDGLNWTNIDVEGDFNGLSGNPEVGVTVAESRTISSSFDIVGPDYYDGGYDNFYLFASFA
jgi:hypothetical protein